MNNNVNFNKTTNKLNNAANKASRNINNIFNNTNKGSQGILGNLDFNFGNVGNTVSNTINRATNTYQSFSGWERFLIIIAIIALISIIGYLIYIRVWLSPGEIFLPDLRNDATKPHTISHQKVPERIADQYSYSFWLYINGHPNDSQYWGSYRKGEWKHVLHRGYKLAGNTASIQSPGFWLAPNTNKIYAAISTNKEVEYITIGDIDMDSWVNITFVRRGSVIEIYKNCHLVKTMSLYHLPTPASQSNLLITQNGGFAGNISHVQYFNKSLTPIEVRNICQANKKIFDKDMNQRVQSSWAGFQPRPIQPTPEPEPEPEEDQEDDQGVCQ